MEVKLTDGYQQRFTSACLAQIGSRKEVTKIENGNEGRKDHADRGGQHTDGNHKVLELNEVRPAQKHDDWRLLDKLSKIVRLPPAIESYRQRLDETQRAVDKMRIEKEPEALVKYPVQGSLYEHQVRAANMALLTFGLADPKEVLK